VDLNAVPLAQIQANTAANQSANLRLGSASKSPQLWHSPKSRGSRSKSAPKPDKLNVTKSRSKDGVEWTIKTGRRGEGKPDFRVRPTDSTGHRVMFRFYDEAGRRRERYSCYLSKAEWRAVQRGSLAKFVALVAGKVEARFSAGDLDAERYREIAPRLKAIA